MKELMTALIEAKVDPEKAEKALTSIENAISSRIEVAKMESYTEKIVPVEMESSGIRSEIRLLAEQMKLGFEKMDQKMDFIRENLEIQIRSVEKHMAFQQKLLWGILGVVIATLFKKYLGLE
ncbi:MAG: hypothetical protein KDK54_22620 [Leptospiraceae bacterium]|nr:hypothetical protein [Leptospiraceae bacterium]